MIDPEIAMQLYDPDTDKYQYIIETVTPNQGLKQVSKNTFNEAMNIAKIYAQRNWSENIPAKYGKIKITKGGIILKVYGYKNKSPFLPLLYDPAPKKAHRGSWLDFVKAHKDMRTAKGLLDLKAISELWKAEKRYDPKKKGQTVWGNYPGERKKGLDYGIELLKKKIAKTNNRMLKERWQKQIERLEKMYDPKIISYGKDTQWNKQLRAAAQAKRSTQGQTKLTGGASTSKRLSEYGFDPAPKRCEPSICAALEKKDIPCDTVDIPALIDSTLSCDENKKNILREVGARKTDKYSKYAAQAKQHYRGQGKLIHASPEERAAAFAQMRQDGTLRGYDPKPPKQWFYAMLQGIKKGSDVRNPASIVSSIWKRLSPGKRASIKSREAKGEIFKYDLPLPEDMSTRGTGTLRMVKPFKLAEVQVNLSVRDYLHALKSGLFSRMKRGDGTTALVKRCKSSSGNANIFIDKIGGKS